MDFSKCIKPPIRIQFNTRIDRRMQLELKKTHQIPLRKVYSTVMSGSLRSRDPGTGHWSHKTTRVTLHFLFVPFWWPNMHI